MPFPFRSNIRDGDIKTGDVVCDYLRPFPPRGTGWHRYVFLLFKQKANLDFPNVSCSTERYLHGSDYACISRHTRTKHWSYLHQRVILVTVFVCKRGPLKRKIFTSSIRMISHRLAWHSFRLNGSLASKTPSIISLVGGAGHTHTHTHTHTSCLCTVVVLNGVCNSLFIVYCKHISFIFQSKCML